MAAAEELSLLVGVKRACRNLSIALELGYHQTSRPGEMEFLLLVRLLVVILDVFSRYVTGWRIAYRETAGLAQQLVAHSCAKQQVTPG